MNRLLFSAVLVGCGLVASTAHAQGVVVPQGGWQSPGYSNPMGPSLQWLWSPQMEKELDIVPEQREALTKLRSDVMTKIRTLWDTSIEDQQERMKRYNEASKALGEETEKKVQDILLPHQIKRIKQIALQMQLQNMGYGNFGALGGDSLAGELKITDEQKAQLQEKQKEIVKENQEKTLEFYKKLQEESREKLLSVLTPSQRKQLDELIGERFQWQPQQGLPAAPAGGVRGVQRVESGK